MQKKDYSKNRGSNLFVFLLNTFLESKKHQNLTLSSTKSKLASGILYLLFILHSICIASGILYLLFILHSIELGYRYIATTYCPKIVQSSSNADAMPKNVAAISTSISRKSYFSNRIGATPLLTFLFIVCLETIFFSTMSSCAKTFYMHWNTSNSIFRIDNTDHIIDVNKGNLAFEFDQVHIICPVYEPGTFENETEKYIIYNVSKVEYETCRITNADPRVIAICDKPQKLMFFTITFRPFTPQPGGLEFLPGNDYYFISTSSKEDLYRRIGGRCSTNNMKVVFKVCCESEIKALPTAIEVIKSISNTSKSITKGKDANTSINANNREFNISSTTHIESNVLHANYGIVHSEINTYSDIPNYYPPQTSAINKKSNSIDGVKVQPSTPNALGSSFENTGFVTRNYNDVTLSGAVDELIPHLSTNYRGQGVILINNVQHSHQKNRNTNLSSNNAGDYNKLPKKVMKNHELAYNGGVSVANCMFCKNYSNLYHRNVIPNCLSKIVHLNLVIIICNIFRFYV